MRLKLFQHRLLLCRGNLSAILVKRAFSHAPEPDNRGDGSIRPQKLIKCRKDRQRPV